MAKTTKPAHTAATLAAQLNRSPKVVRAWIRRNTEYKAPYNFTKTQFNGLAKKMTA